MNNKLAVTTKTLLMLGLLSACQSSNLDSFSKATKAFFEAEKVTKDFEQKASPDQGKIQNQSLADILKNSRSGNNVGSDFPSVIKYALDNDPSVSAKRRESEARLAAVEVKEALKEFQVTGTFYGGLEDLSDNTGGVALDLRASRSIYDGGKLDSEIAAKKLNAAAAKLELQATIDERAYRLAIKWIELEKYETLQKQINSRLEVLDPLIEQLEKVAKAGVGDVSKVTAAQRTVSAIRVTQTSIAEGLAKAKLEFTNAYGSLTEAVPYDAAFVAGLVPQQIDEDAVKRAPLLQAKYARYEASLAMLDSLRAKDEYDVGFEVRAMTPLAGSGYDSEESLGLVARKTLFSGGMLESQIKEAEIVVEAEIERIKETFRQGNEIVSAAQKSIVSMDKAILLARKNAKLTSDEIVYLKQQLIIGGSTLDNVLSAEAQLYEAESQEIKFEAEKRKSQISIISTLGLLSTELGY